MFNVTSRFSSFFSFWENKLYTIKVKRDSHGHDQSRTVLARRPSESE